MQPATFCVYGQHEALVLDHDPNQASTPASRACGHPKVIKTIFSANSRSGPPLLALTVPYVEHSDTRRGKPRLSDAPVSVTMDDGTTYNYKLFAALLKSPVHYCDAVLEGNTWLIQDGMENGGRGQPSINNKPSCIGFNPVLAVYCRV